jgi:hypothetical protein
MQGTGKKQSCEMVNSTPRTYGLYKESTFFNQTGEVLINSSVGIPLTLPGLTPPVRAKFAV